MGRKYAIRDQEEIHFVTFTVVNWVDVFIRDEYKEILVESFNYCSENKGMNVHAYCIMTSHVHLILSVKKGLKLSDVIRDLKTYTSKSLLKAIENYIGESRKEWMIWMFARMAKKNKRNSNFQFWQQHNHPIALDNQKLMDQRINYIHMNPVVAGFVDDPNHWIWSSCRDYEMNKKGKIQLDLL